MKKFLLLLISFIFIGTIDFSVYAANSRRSARSAKRGTTSQGRTARKLASATVRVSSSKTTNTSSETEEEPSEDKYTSCMDKICKQDGDDDRGRCRCSTQLGRIEKVLRDIEKIQNKADKQNKEMEALMYVSNTSGLSDAVGNVYNNINTIERKAKTMASEKVDTKTLVAEGLPLYKKAYSECKAFLPEESDKHSKKEQEYNTLIETDCAAYTSILKEKADAAQGLLVQAQKNQEMYQEQQYKQLNQLDTNACFVEYENCLKTECGEEYRFCKEHAKLEANLKKCQSINYGKCEENKAVVLKDLRKAVNKALKKEAVAQSCRSSMGIITKGKCLYQVQYAADSCTILSKCGTTQEKWFNPGHVVRCDDKSGDFKDLVAGCHESCYLIGPNGEQTKIGDNRKSGSIGLFRTIGIGCTVDKFTLPIPAGWGIDGYPTDEELKNAF